jgi:hypothetical protein
MYKDDGDLLTRAIQVLRDALEVRTTPSSRTPLQLRRLAFNARILCLDASYYFEKLYDPGKIPPSRRSDKHARTID